MNIEIWSDVTCPFCYLGKHYLQNALEQFPHRDEVSIEWKSFELDPNAETDPEGDIYELLASKYGRSREWAVRANEDLRARAEETGLSFNPDAIVPANSFDAHRLMHLAAEHGLLDGANERLFEAYFSNGENIGDRETLKSIADEIGLPPGEVKEMLESDNFSEEVRADEREAAQIGVRAVPFFLIDRKYAVRGAQLEEVFLRVLQNYRKEEPAADQDAP